jgi:nucleoside-diphosphate-sugar epimerase
VPVEVDLFDGAGLRLATRGVSAIAHFATKIPAMDEAMRPGAWEMNDRLRIETPRLLVEAAEANGVRRVIFESISLAYPDRGEEWIDETAPLLPLGDWPLSAATAEATLAEFGWRGGEPVSLRYANLYGPGRASGALIAAVAEGRMPIIGSGENFVSSIHVEDVGSSVVAALAVAPGVYNVGDDQPLRQREYLTHLARLTGGPAPVEMSYDEALEKLGVFAKTAAVSQRVSSRAFREATGWAPRFPSAIEGWQDVVQRERAGIGVA